MQAAQTLFEEAARRHTRKKVAVRSPGSGPAQRYPIENSGELASCIAHEVSQPLTGVVANASAALQWLSRDVPDLDKVRECLAEVIAAGQYACDVLTNVQVIFSNDAHEQDMVDVNRVIRTALGLVRRDLTKYEIKIETHLSEHIPPIRGNRVQLQQVITNLVTNAIQAMNSAEARVLGIRSDPIKPGAVRVSVEDTGTGIDLSNLDRIFEPGFTTKADGMGIGLAICRSIIERHNGRIWASAGVSHGSTFHFELPAADSNGFDPLGGHAPA